MGWVRGYEDAWRNGDLDALDELFAADVRYRRSPYHPPSIGLAALKEFWLEDEGETFTVNATPVAVDGDAAVVRLEVRYGDPVRQEYRDLWVLHFDDAGRVDDYEEWPYWPGEPFTAAGDGLPE